MCLLGSRSVETAPDMVLTLYQQVRQGQGLRPATLVPGHLRAMAA